MLTVIVGDREKFGSSLPSLELGDVSEIAVS
jgi:hypothetical protein